MVSLIVPAHNERSRLIPTLESYVARFTVEYGSRFEIIVVCNGCTDETAELVRHVALPNVLLVEIDEAIGKGGAIVVGFLAARGSVVAFADADGSTSADSLLDLIGGLRTNDIVIGSRRVPGSRILRRQPGLRWFLGQSFAIAVRALFGMPYRDTQCGAKAMRIDVASQLAMLISERDWAFDVDLLLLARRLKLDVLEFPVEWTDVPGSKVRLFPTFMKVMASLLSLKRREQTDSSNTRRGTHLVPRFHLTRFSIEAPSATERASHTDQSDSVAIGRRAA